MSRRFPLLALGLAIAWCLIWWPHAGHTYGNDTEPAKGPGVQAGPHSTLNRLALRRFIRDVASKDPVLRYYDFEASPAAYGIHDVAPDAFLAEGLTVAAAGQFNVDEVVVRKPFAWWVFEGGYSADEPEIFMSLRHFYDPCMLAVDNAAGGAHVAYLTDDLNRLAPAEWLSEATAVNPKMDAKRWALTESPYSWKAGIDRLNKNSETADQRRAAYGFSWRSLGECMHLLADMTVPAHVRNDSHPGKTSARSEKLLNLKADPYEAFMTSAAMRTYAAGTPEPAVVELVRKAKTFGTLFQDLAVYTNETSFSQDTISGIDHVTGQAIHSLNGQPDYPSPKLEQYTWRPDSSPANAAKGWGFCDSANGFTELTRREDGRYGIFESEQARRLAPAALEANVKLLDLFIPRYGIRVIDMDLQRRTVRCRVIQYERTEEGAYRPAPCSRMISSQNSALLLVWSGSAPQARHPYLTGATLFASVQLGDLLGGLKKKAEDEINKEVQKAKDQLGSSKPSTKEGKPVPAGGKADVQSVQPEEPVLPEGDKRRGARSYWVRLQDETVSEFTLSLPEDIIFPAGEGSDPGGLSLVTGLDAGGILIQSAPVAVCPVRVSKRSDGGYEGSIQATNYTEPLCVEWDWGDGTSVVASESDRSPEAYRAQHGYETAGAYTLTVRVLNASRDVLLATGRTRVSADKTLPETPGSQSPDGVADVQIDWSRDGADPSGPVLFTLGYTLQPDDLVRWRYGDGADGESRTPSSQHVYAKDGVYTVQAVVRRQNRDVARGSVRIELQPRSPYAGVGTLAEILYALHPSWSISRDLPNLPEPLIQKLRSIESRRESDWYGFKQRPKDTKSDGMSAESLISGYYKPAGSGVLRRKEDKDGFFDKSKADSLPVVEYPWVAWYEVFSDMGLHETVETANTPMSKLGVFPASLDLARNKAQRAREPGGASSDPDGGSADPRFRDRLTQPLAIGDAGYRGSPLRYTREILAARRGNSDDDFRDNECLAVSGPLWTLNRVVLRVAIKKPRSSQYSPPWSQDWQWTSFTADNGWLNGAEFESRVLALLNQRPQVAQELTRQQLSEWADWCRGHAIRSGSGFLGFYTPNHVPYWPKPNEIAAGASVDADSGKYPWEAGYQPVNAPRGANAIYHWKRGASVLRAEVNLYIHPWSLHQSPVVDCMEQYNKTVATLKPVKLALTGADDAVQMQYRDAGENCHVMVFRRANVFASIRVWERGNPNAGPIAEAKRIAELVLSALAAPPYAPESSR